MLLLFKIYLIISFSQNLQIRKRPYLYLIGDSLPPEGEDEVDLTKYYPTSPEIPNSELPDVSLKNLSMAAFLLGLIAFMVNALMVYLYIRQEWVIIWPSTTAAQVGVVLMGFAAVVYLANHFMEKKQT
jgi:hypothetical protein